MCQKWRIQASNIIIWCKQWHECDNYKLQNCTCRISIFAVNVKHNLLQSKSIQFVASSIVRRFRMPTIISRIDDYSSHASATWILPINFFNQLESESEWIYSHYLLMKFIIIKFIERTSALAQIRVSENEIKNFFDLQNYSMCIHWLADDSSFRCH